MNTPNHAIVANVELYDSQVNPDGEMSTVMEVAGLQNINSVICMIAVENSRRKREDFAPIYITIKPETKKV